MDWSRTLGLPASTLAGDKTIPKTVITKQGDLTKTEQRHLKQLRRLGHYATVAQANARIAAIQDDEHDIASVIYLRCELARDCGTSGLVGVLHKVFPNPVVLLMEEPGGKAGVSVSLKRRSLAEKGAVVVERAETSRLFAPESPGYADYMLDIRHATLPQSSLLAYVEAICDRTARAGAIPTLGQYPRCKDEDTSQLMQLLSELREIDGAISVLRERYRSKDASIAETSRIRRDIRMKESVQEQVKLEIAGLCHD